MLWHILSKTHPFVLFYCEDCNRQCIARSLHRPTTCPNDDLPSKKIWERLSPNSWECSGCEEKCLLYSVIQPTICLHARVL